MEFGDAAVKDTSERRWMEDAIVETETNRAVSYTHLTLPTKRIV